jgi:hypothetical protein
MVAVIVVVAAEVGLLRLRLEDLLKHGLMLANDKLGIRSMTDRHTSD